MPKDEIAISAGPRLKIALAVAIAADLCQLALFPMFVEGVFSPASDLLDVAMAAGLTAMLGWHWEFLPSAAAKLIPTVDMVPLWTLAVANVYRKARHEAIAAEAGR